jgi:hypothetical protein
MTRRGVQVEAARLADGHAVVRPWAAHFGKRGRRALRGAWTRLRSYDVPLQNRAWALTEFAVPTATQPRGDGQETP